MVLNSFVSFFWFLYVLRVISVGCWRGVCEEKFSGTIFNLEGDGTSLKKNIKKICMLNDFIRNALKTKK